MSDPVEAKRETAPEDTPARARAAASRLVRAPLSLTFGASASIQVLNVLTGVLIAQILGPAGRGELTAALLWPTILASLGTLGFHDAISYSAARSAAAPRVLAGTSLVLSAVQSVVLMALGALVLPSVLAAYDDTTVAASQAFLLFIPLSLSSLYFAAILNGLGHYGRFNLVRFLVIVTTVIGLVALALADTFTVPNAVLVYLGANVLTFLVGGSLLAAVMGGTPKVDRRVIRELLSFGIRGHGSNVSTALNQRLDQLVIAAFLTPLSLGLYVTAVAMTSLGTLIASSVSFVALPTLATVHDTDERVRIVRRYSAVAVGSTVAMSVPLILFAPSLLAAVFGEAFRPAAEVARVLLVASVFLAAGRVLGSALKAVNKPLDATVAELIALGVTLASLAVLLPTLGILGAGIASLLAYGAGAVWAARKLSQALAVPALRLWAPRIRPA